MKRNSLTVLTLLFLAGCGTRLNVEETFDLPLAGKQKIIDAINKEQTIKVTATADAPIRVYVYLEKDQDKVQTEIVAKRYQGVLAHKEDADNISLEARIPAKENAVVRIDRSLGKGAHVKLKITNR